MSLIQPWFVVVRVDMAHAAYKANVNRSFRSRFEIWKRCLVECTSMRLGITRQ